MQQPLLPGSALAPPVSVQFHEVVLAPKTQTIDFEFKDLGLKLKSGKSVLNGVTGTIRCVWAATV